MIYLIIFMLSLVNAFLANFKISKEFMQLNCNDKDVDIYDRFETYSRDGNKLMQQKYLFKIWHELKQKKKLRKYIDKKFNSTIDDKSVEKS